MSINKKIVLTVVLVIILLIIIIVVVKSLSNSQSQKTAAILPTPSATIGTTVAQPEFTTKQTNYTYTNPQQHLFFQYPSNFSIIQNTSPTDTSVTFTFVDNNKKYRFFASPPGQINPEGSQATHVEEKEVTYAGQGFLRRIWMEGNKPFYIVAIPLDLTTVPYFFSMELPPNNTDSYIHTFENILGSYTNKN